MYVTSGQFEQLVVLFAFASLMVTEEIVMHFVLNARTSAVSILYIFFAFLSAIFSSPLHGLLELLLIWSPRLDVQCSSDLPLQHKIFTLGTFDLEQSTEPALSDKFTSPHDENGKLKRGQTEMRTQVQSVTSPHDEDYKLIIDDHRANFKFYIAQVSKVCGHGRE
jgi:hypothetical protein